MYPYMDRFIIMNYLKVFFSAEWIHTGIYTNKSSYLAISAPIDFIVVNVWKLIFFSSFNPGSASILSLLSLRDNKRNFQ